MDAGITDDVTVHTALYDRERGFTTGYALENLLIFAWHGIGLVLVCSKNRRVYYYMGCFFVFFGFDILIF